MIKNDSKVLKYIFSYKGGNKSSCFDCNNGCFMYRIDNTAKQEYEDYLKYLDSEGFALYDSHQIRDNYFATYISDTLLLQVFLQRMTIPPESLPTPILTYIKENRMQPVLTLPILHCTRWNWIIKPLTAVCVISPNVQTEASLLLTALI